MPTLNNNNAKIDDEEEAIFDETLKEALKSNMVRKKLEMLAQAVIEKYPTNKKIKTKI